MLHKVIVNVAKTCISPSSMTYSFVCLWILGIWGIGSCCCPQRPTTFRAKRGKERGFNCSGGILSACCCCLFARGRRGKEEEIGLNKLSALEERRKRWERGTKEEGPTYERRRKQPLLNNVQTRVFLATPSIPNCTVRLLLKDFAFKKN